MAPFGRKKEPTVEDQAAQAMLDWAQSVSLADLAVELLGAFGSEGRHAIDRVELAHWLLFRTVRLHPSDLTIEALCVVEEAAQLLEHAELIRIAGDCWSVNRLGTVTLSHGKTAVRQRIKDRTGL